MSIIMGAGKKVDWSPKDESLVKIASTDAKEIEQIDPVYEAAKKYLKAQADEFNFEKKDEVKSEGVESVEEVKKDDAGSPKDEAIIEIETPEGEAKEESGKDSVEVAVEKIEEGVADLKDAANIVDQAENAEIEIEVDEVPEGLDVSVPGEKPMGNAGEVMVESSPEEKCKSCGCPIAKTDKAVKTAEAKKEPCKVCKKEECVCEDKDEKGEKKEEVKEASKDEEFCKFAKLSPENKKKLANYWTNMLGYPKDYVSLMTKDY